MNIEEAAEFREISKRVNTGHATRAEIERVLEVVGREPLYGHITGKGHNTLWAVHVKMEGAEK